MRLDGKNVVIIGGSSGIGLETARLALDAGAKVTIAGRSEDRLRRAAESLIGSANDGSPRSRRDRLRTAVADVADDESVRALFEGESRVDHVFLPAGDLKPGAADVLGADMESLRSILDVRLLGAARVVRAARPRMDDGSITLMSGLYSTRPAKGGAIGAAAVAGVEGMVRALALDLAPIRVNAVAPGLIETPLWDSFGPERREDILQSGGSRPVGRAGRPEEVAEAVLLLMTNGFLTGTILPIDGGGALA